MPFDLDKKNTLFKLKNLDKSKKGSIDEEIVDLINFINSMENFYTTSSCSGRIMLIKEGKSSKKYDTTWIFASHKTVKIADFKPYFANLPMENVWLRMEAPILHICCRRLKDAKKLLNLTNKTGFRRAGAITLGRRIIIELVAPGTLDVLYSAKNKFLLSEDYLKIVLIEANKKLIEARKRLDRFYEELKIGV